MFGSSDRRLKADLAAARERIAELETELERVAGHDTLSGGLLTMSVFHNRLDEELRRGMRYGRPLSLILVDIDDFGRLNLEHGFGAGDLAIGAVGGAIATSIRTHDLACRIGGDEFAILLPETGEQQAMEAAERVVAAVATLEVGAGALTASAGVAGTEAAHTAEALLAAAGTALDRARDAGGGRVAIAPTDADGAAIVLSGEPGADSLGDA
jgi:diguanylate cyclase (GGDEF)-like protein